MAPDDRVADGQRLVALGEFTAVVVGDQLPPGGREVSKMVEQQEELCILCQCEHL